MMPNKWEIWMAAFAYEDKPGQVSDRPVLVLENKEMYPVLVTKITKHAPREGYTGEYSIKKWKEAGLDYPSTVRLSKRLKLQETDFRRKRGRLHPIDIIEIQKLLSEMKPA